MTSLSSDVFFAFGPAPGTYILDTVQSLKYWGMPTTLIEQLAKGPGLRKLHTLGIGERADIAAFWLSKDGTNQSWVSDGFTANYPGLGPKVKAWTKDYGHASFSMTLGHRCDAGTCVDAGEQNLWNLDATARKAIADSKGVRHVALGLGVAVFFLHDGGAWYDLKGAYPTLYKVMSDYKPGNITFVALNPWRADEFILVNNNDTAWLKLHHTFAKEVELVLRSEAICVYNYTPNRPCSCGCSNGGCNRPEKQICLPPKPPPCNDCPAKKPGCGCNGAVHKAPNQSLLTDRSVGRSVASSEDTEVTVGEDDGLFEVV